MTYEADLKKMQKFTKRAVVYLPVIVVGIVVSIICFEQRQPRHTELVDDDGGSGDRLRYCCLGFHYAGKN